ncbi:hypothetical protein FRZ06_01200 [Anoxybacterium hadale]|uniref:Uncharacterized protein n=1 Tax=Anoxybacterium hadale TaxID=3408580 RepID=A0ACD1A6U4_9FIRM|nr:hypothetical protein FRZ06_01200 [Clostridiales bacterium]
MKNRYDKIMNKIEVTPEIRNRILDNINDLDFDQVKVEAPRTVVSFSRYRKYLSIAACFMILFFGSVMVHNLIQNSPQEQVVPDIVNYDTVEELSKAVGFGAKEVQSLPFEVETIQYTVYWKELAEVQYTGQENTVLLRMAQGSEDISGNSTEYSNTKVLAVNGSNVTLKGDGDKYVLAIWQSDGYSYSLDFTEGISETEMLTAIQSIR